jgi:hypothetical protein
MTEQTCTIDAERLISDLTELGGVGQAADGGYYREAFSRADLEGRGLVEGFMKAAATMTASLVCYPLSLLLEPCIVTGSP